MSEGTAREIVMKAMADFVNSLVDTSDPAFRYTPEQFDKEADAVLAALTEAGALAPAGLTDGLNSEEWYDLESAVVDAINAHEDSDNRDMERRYEALLAKLRAQRAIAATGDGA